MRIGAAGGGARGWVAATGVAVLAGAGFLLFRNAAYPLWLDEAYSTYAASKGWAFLWTIVPRYETHPPFYYSLLRLWTLAFGDGLAAVRSIGVVAVLAAVPVVAIGTVRLAAIGRLPRRRMLFAGVAAFALHPLVIEMGRQVRPYPVMILAYAVAIVALLGVARRRAQGEGGRGAIAGRDYTAYLVALAAMLWLHNLGPLYGAALGLGCLAVTLRPGMRGRDWAWLIGGHLLVAAAWAPALLILIDQAPTWVADTWLRFDPGQALGRAPMLYGGPEIGGMLAAAALAATGARGLWRAGQWQVLALLLATALVPVLLALALSIAVTPVFLLRTLVPVAVPAVLLMSVGVADGAGWRLGARLAVLAILLGTMIDSDIAGRRRGPQENWYPMVRWLAARFRPGDLVIAYPNEGALPFDRAARDLGLILPVRPIPGPIPSLSPPPGSRYVSGSRGVPSLDAAHLHAIAAAPAMRRVPTIWLLRVGPWAYDKGDVALHLFQRERTPAGWARSGPITLVGLRRGGPRTSPRSP